MNKWNFYTSKEIKPSGWLKRQLEIQAKGLSGNLQKCWPDIQDSAWIGGTRSSWEKVPYWLDGFVPLAYLLEDEALIADAQRYIDEILARQEEDGWICPCAPEKRKEYDTWAVLLISKTLLVYYECSGDERAVSAIYKALKNFYELLKSGELKLFAWGQARWFEAFIALNFLYARQPEDWMRDFAKILKTQGSVFETFIPKWKRPLNVWQWETHIVNLAMMFKYEAVSHEILGDEYTDAAQKLYDILKEYNGTPVELFTGDECLSGISPIQGTELCSVVELMYSYEHLFAHTGDRKWAEKLEVLAFNALPATISDDMWTHQYLQMSNQMACQRFPGKSLFRTNDNEAHMFGLEPHYGCCTANFNQGWPKFALATFMHNGNEVINTVPVPAILDCEQLYAKLDTEYPFKNTLKYTLKAKQDASFTVRIPSFAKNVKVDGKAVPTEDITVTLKAGEEKIFAVSFETTPYFESRPNDLTTVKCGSLVFSVPVKYTTKMYEYEKNGRPRKFPYCDYEYIPQSDWNYAYCDDELTVEEREINDIPFSSSAPAIVIKTKAKHIAWGLEDGYETVCAKVPESREPIGDAEAIELYPYGSAKLRMTEIPKI